MSKHTLLFSAKKKLKKGVFFWRQQYKNILVLVAVSLVLVSFLMVSFITYRNGQLNMVLSYFDTLDSNQQNTLFYTDSCSHCKNVDDFIVANNIENTFKFTRVNVLGNNSNVSLLADKAQTCGLDQRYIAVPFLWDAAAQKCIIGEVDIINFLQSKIPAKKR